MPSVVTAIIAAGRNGTIDYIAGQTCDVAIKVFTCIKTNGPYDHFNYMETKLYLRCNKLQLSNSNVGVL